MAPLHQAGHDKPDLDMPQLVDPAALAHRIEHGEWVVDLRARKAYATGHLRGTVSSELADPFATYLGWTVPWDAPLTLVGDSPETFKDLAAERAERGDEMVLLDVHRRDEWDERHIEGAVHIPFHDLQGRQDEVPDGPGAGSSCRHRLRGGPGRSPKPSAAGDGSPGWWVLSPRRRRPP